MSMQGIERLAPYKQNPDFSSLQSGSTNQPRLFPVRKPSILGKRNRKRTEIKTNKHYSKINNDLKKRKKRIVIPKKSELRTIGNGLVVKRSTLPGSRNGVFVSHDVCAGEYITWYEGTVFDVSAKQRKELFTDYGYWSHLISIDQYTLIQGIKRPPTEAGIGLGSLINDGPVSGIADNVEYVKLQEKKEVYIRAKRFVKKGEELFIRYGKSYWSRFQKQFPVEYARIHIGKTRVRKPTPRTMCGP